MTGRRWWGVAAVAVLVVVVALVGWLVQDDDDPGAGAAQAAADASPSLPSSSGLGSPTITPSPGQTEPEVADEPKEKPGVVRTEIGEVASIERGLTVQVVKTEAVKGKAQGPGEVAGPAVRVTVELVNDTASTLDLRAVTVTAFAGPRSKPAGELSGPGAKQFPASVEAGESATGVLVFRMPPGQRGEARIDVSYRGESPTAVFTGSVR